MLLVIFGAGASYDSACSRLPPEGPSKRTPVDDIRPPLAKELFEEREIFRSPYRTYSQFGAVVNRLRSAGNSIEDVLGQLANEAENTPQRKSQLMAIRYYIKEAIETCCYSGLKKPITRRTTAS